MLKSRQRIFEMGNKASKLLAYQACSAAASRLITKITSPTVAVLSDTREINKSFLNFYSEVLLFSPLNAPRISGTTTTLLIIYATLYLIKCFPATLVDWFHFLKSKKPEKPCQTASPQGPMDLQWNFIRHFLTLYAPNYKICIMNNFWMVSCQKHCPKPLSPCCLRKIKTCFSAAAGDQSHF